MDALCKVIREMMVPNFMNIRTSIQTYDRDALCCAGSGTYRSIQECSTDRQLLQQASSRCGCRRLISMSMTAYCSADTAKVR